MMLRVEIPFLTGRIVPRTMWEALEAGGEGGALKNAREGGWMKIHVCHWTLARKILEQNGST